MGAVGATADSALAETFDAAFKREVLQSNTCWADATPCCRQVFRWVARYNTNRRHSHCGYFSPVNYEKELAHPRRCHQELNHKCRGHYIGSRPVLGVRREGA